MKTMDKERSFSGPVAALSDEERLAHVLLLQACKGSFRDLLAVYLKAYREELEMELTSHGQPDETLREMTGGLRLVRKLEYDIKTDMEGL